MHVVRTFMRWEKLLELPLAVKIRIIARKSYGRVGTGKGLKGARSARTDRTGRETKRKGIITRSAPGPKNLNTNNDFTTTETSSFDRSNKNQLTNFRGRGRKQN